VQGAAEGHIVTYVAEGDAPDWGCDVVWSGKEPTDAEATRHRENCIAVFGVFYRLIDEEHVHTDEFFLKLEETANIYLDEESKVCFLQCKNALLDPFQLDEVLSILHLLMHVKWKLHD
jgi:hypothetical protein